MNILFVDDDADICLMVHANLSALGYSITCVESAKIALAFLESNEVPLVITDLRMPGMDGIQLAEIINEKYKDVKTVLITGYADANSMIRSITSGIHNFIVKPISIEQIEKLIVNTLAA